MLMVYLTFCTILLNFELFSLTFYNVKINPKQKKGKREKFGEWKLGKKLYLPNLPESKP